MRKLVIIVFLASIAVVGCSDSRKGASPKVDSESARNWVTGPTAGADKGLPPLQSAEMEPNTNSFSRVDDNRFLNVKQNPLSTFSIDVDTASYSVVRKFLAQKQLPPKDAVRIEELINYFSYSYPQPRGDDPFSVTTEVAPCPWNSKHFLARIGLKGREIALEKRPPTNLVFLLDVSGSMYQANRLPLVKKALSMLVTKLTENDRIAIVVYAGQSGLVLPSTSGVNQESILSALEHLQAGGSTNGGQGIQLAYQVAVQNFIKGGVNRVILATDGDFNVGLASEGDLTRLIEEKAKSGVFLTALGFGMGNYKDATLETLADRGNGNYSYIDNEAEAKKVLVEQMTGTLITIAKDVKIQVEFNPECVGGYRLIGYENRILHSEDFNDDKKDAGEIGAGHSVTALYELLPPGETAPGSVDPLKYSSVDKQTNATHSNEMMNVKLRFKQPDGVTSRLIEQPVSEDFLQNHEPSADFRFAAAVASFGMLLRDSEHKGNSTYSQVLSLAESATAADPTGRRAEFLELVRQAALLRR